MKILVVGGAGYVGTTVVPTLQDRGYDVEVFDLQWFGNHLPKHTKIQKKEIFDLREEDLKPFEQVIFLAGLSNDPMAEYSPARNFIENGAAPSYLAYIAKKAGVKRFIYGGSCSVYGYTVDELYDETRPAVSDYPYAISKLQGESGTMQLCDDKFSVICFRKGTVSGYSPRMRLDLIVNTMFKTAILEDKIMVNNPSIWRPILSIHDAASAYVRAVEAQESISGVFNIASGNYTVGEVADYVQAGIREHMGKDPKIIIKHIKDFRNYKVDIKKASDILSFKPNHNVKAIVKDLIDNRSKFADLNDERFYNIQVFKKISPQFASEKER